MAHSVEVNISNHPLSREENGIVFVVSEGDGRFGELVVSKGGLRWRPRGKHQPHFMTWTEFDRSIARGAQRLKGAYLYLSLSPRAGRGSG